ncbi:MAG TPA: carboxymuconolactone decarboxylase family protein [Gaiellaceae bacterium]|jgi:4-carboxymuconolactone decarboxylase|nr:carboxymuconolactone decarboxylase family protein [Gaiellaceae bacterium]
MAEGADRTARGRAVYASQFGLPEPEAIAQLEGTVGKRMAAEAVDAAAGAWVEDCLSLRDRSLVVVAALIAQGGVEARLRTHVRWALEHGLTAEQLEAAAALLAVYVGYPRASVAMEVIRDVTEQASAPGTS